MTLYQLPLQSRDQLGVWLTAQGLTGSAVEVGTHRGDSARVLLENWPGRLWCVDPWQDLPGYENQAESLRALGGSENREGDLAACQEAVYPYRDRVEIMRLTSSRAYHKFPDNTYDLVYLDADHREGEVREDLARWWPKVRSGGVLAGHDFLCPGEHEGGWGAHVQRAVLAFAHSYNLDIALIVEQKSLPWSFVLRKP